jgi:hypothetical protein
MAASDESGYMIMPILKYPFKFVIEDEFLPLHDKLTMALSIGWLVPFSIT